MLFAVTCHDKPDHEDLRKQTRDDHIAWTKQGRPRIVLGGPLLSQDGERMVGSLLVVEGDTEETVREALDADPYAKAGLFASVTVQPWRWTVNKPDDV